MHRTYLIADFRDMTLFTDYEPLADAATKGTSKLLLSVIVDFFRETIPEFEEALVESIRLLQSKRLRPNLITYLNFRLQVWTTGFDADGTPSIRLIPKGITVDPSGPVIF